MLVARCATPDSCSGAEPSRRRGHQRRRRRVRHRRGHQRCQRRSQTDARRCSPGLTRPLGSQWCSCGPAQVHLQLGWLRCAFGQARRMRRAVRRRARPAAAAGGAQAAARGAPSARAWSGPWSSTSASWMLSCTSCAVPPVAKLLLLQHVARPCAVRDFAIRAAQAPGAGCRAAGVNRFPSTDRDSCWKAGDV